ncbi:hypothetical protein KAU08_05000, partial [bacterium]|nr:hypothetical protein [bacterium]
SYWWEKGHGVAIDEFDDIYAVGLFRGLCDFDPGTGVDEHTSSGYEAGGFDAYITKFNSDGDHQWAHTWGDVNTAEDTGDIAFGVAADSSNDVYVVGGFLGTVDFDPGVGVVEFASYGLWGDVYLLKFSPAGDFEWVNTWEAVGYSDFPGTAQMWGGSYVYVDPSDYVLVTGFFEGTKDLDPGPEVQLFEGDAGFLSKFDSSGNFLWADIWPCSGLIQMMCYSVAADSEGNIYMGGEIAESVDLDPGPDTDYRSPNGYRDGILVKLDPDGGYLWGNNWGSSTPSSDNFCESWGVATYGTTSVYACGFFMGEVDFDPGPGIEIHSSSGWGSFLTKFLSDGSW